MFLFRLSQIRGGGTTPLAAGVLVGQGLIINENGVPTASGSADGTWEYKENSSNHIYYLTLKSGIWDFSNCGTITCRVNISSDATVVGGKFATIVINWGTIKGGEYPKCYNYGNGIINGGMFALDPNNASDNGWINGGSSSTINGGIFGKLPNEGNYGSANKYCIEFADNSTDTLSVNGVDFVSNKVYVVGMDNEELTITANSTDLTNVNQTRNSATSSKTITFKPGSVKQESEKDGDTYLLKLNAKLYNSELVIGADGKPNTSNAASREEDNKTIWYGTGWTYDGTTLKLNPTEAKTFELGQSGGFLKCKLEVGEKATVKGWIFLSRPVENHGVIDGPKFHTEGGGYSGYPNLTNYGTVKNCYVDYGYVTNNGTMENVSFLVCKSLTNNAGATIKNAVVRTDGRNMAYNNSGTIKNAVFEFKPSGETVHVLKTEGDGKNPSASVEGCSYGVSASQVYIIGEPVLKARIYDTVNGTYVTITNVNGNTSYGGLTTDKDQNNYQKFTVQSGDTELVLNKTISPTYDENLVIGTDGKPVTENRKPYGNGGVQGEGWTYINDTLTLSGTFEFAEDDYTQIDCSVIVGSGAKLSNAAVVGSDATVMNNGTITNCYFGNPSVTVINNGEISNSLFVKKPNGTGTLSGCLFASDEGLPKEHWTVNLNYSDDKTAYAGLQDNPFEMSVNKFYVIADASGTLPTITLSENYYNGPLPAQVTVTAPDGAWWKQEINNNSLTIVQPTYKLTLVDAELVGMTGTEFTENATIKIKPKFDDEELELASWTSDTDKFNVNTITKNEDGTYTLKMPGDALTLTANSRKKTYSLTVVGDGAYIQDPTTGTEFDAGTVVMVDINVPDGKIFTGWTVSDGVKLSYIGADVDLHSEQIIFNMPAANVTLTANFETARTNILFNEDGTLNLDGVKNNRGDGWYYSDTEGALYLNPATATEYDFTHVNPQNKDGAKLDAVKVPIHVVNSTVTIAGGTFKAEVESTVTNATFKNCVFNGEVDIQTICNVDNCIFTKDSTITNLYGEQNCLFEKEPGGSIMTYELTEKTGATVTATLDGCEGEVSGTTLYFSGTPTLKVKVADGIVEKANGEAVGDAENGWYTVTAKNVMAEDDEQIVLTKGTSTPDPVDPNPTPNPDDQPTTYTVTVKGGTIDKKTEVKAEKDTELTVDVDEKEVPDGMTFDVWSISFPEGVKDTLTPSVKLHDPHMTFTMPEADITIEAQYRSSELPGEDDGPSALGTMATVAVGGAAAGILVWQGVSLGVDSYLQLNLPKGVAVPANRRELVVLLWETAGKPETALPSLYSDLPAEEIELQKATRWAIDNGLVKPADDSDASRFDPDRYVTKYDVFGAWLKLKKLMK